jgi:hypothetical protein
VRCCAQTDISKRRASSDQLSGDGCTSAGRSKSNSLVGGGGDGGFDGCGDVLAAALLSSGFAVPAGARRASLSGGGGGGGSADGASARFARGPDGSRGFNIPRRGVPKRSSVSAAPAEQPAMMTAIAVAVA